MERSASESNGWLWWRAKNFVASFFFVTCAFLAYRFSPHSRGLREYTDERMGISGIEVLTAAYMVYSLLLLFFYLSEKTPGTSKSVAALRALYHLVFPRANESRGELPREERLGLLTVLLKGFFAPLMLLSLFQFTSSMAANGMYLYCHVADLPDNFLTIFNSHGFWFLLQLILFLDVVFYTFGYLIEHPALKNEIRSVDPTWLGWAVALACYPPFNVVTARLLGGNIADFPRFESPVVHITVNVMLLLLMAVYASASIALNFKASNLTHRGIVSRGPYRFVRHPAYTTKNLAWWLGSLPALATAWEKSAWSFFLSVCCVAAWTTLYALRSITEESHLRQVDGEYDAYCQKVRWRFVPGIY